MPQESGGLTLQMQGYGVLFAIAHSAVTMCSSIQNTAVILFFAAARNEQEIAACDNPLINIKHLCVLRR